jgi:Flp pilus assembly CpaE family ATPase
MRTILVGLDQPLNRDLVTAFAEFPEIELVRQVAPYPAPDDLLRILRARRPDFVFISAADFARFESLVAAIDDRSPGLPVICVSGVANPLELIPKLMHLGVRELLTPPITQERLGEVIASIARQLSKRPSPVVHLGDLYAFFPAKPGVGSSTITVSTSCALADELRIRTLLLDCDLMAGVTKFLLKLGNSSSIVNAMDHADTLDEDLWSQMVGHWDGLEVFHAGELAPPATLTAASLEVVLGFARGLYDTICADLASSLDPFTVQIMREARRIFMVTTPELVPLYLAADRLRHLKDLGLADKVSLLLNRKNPSHRGLSDHEAAQLVGMPIAHQFSNDYTGVQGAILDGVPISHRSSLGQSIMTLARSLAPQASRLESEPAHHRKFLEFFHVPSARDHETVWRD